MQASPILRGLGPGTLDRVFLEGGVKIQIQILLGGRGDSKLKDEVGSRLKS